MLDTLPYCPH